MASEKSRLRICPRGHRYHKTSDCPVCPKCETLRKPASGFLAGLVAPARRALENKNIRTLAALANYSEREILALHGMGPGSMPRLRKALQSAGLTFRPS